MSPRREVTNWSKLQRFQPREIHEPSSEDELADVVRRAASEGRRVKVKAKIGAASGQAVAGGDSSFRLEGASFRNIGSNERAILFNVRTQQLTILDFVLPSPANTEWLRQELYDRQVFRQRYFRHGNLSPLSYKHSTCVPTF